MTTLTTPLVLKTPTDFPMFAPGLPWIGPTLELVKDPIAYHLEARKQCGPIYRTTFWGEPTLCFGGLEVNEFVWQNSDLWDYSITRAGFGEEFGKTYLTQLDGKPHAKKRRRLNPSFRPEFLMSASQAMNQVVQDRVGAMVGQTTDLRALCHRLLLNMTSRALLKYDIVPEMEDAIVSVEKDLLLGGLFGPARRLWFNRPSYRSLKKKVIGLLGELVDQQLAKETQPDDMFGLAIKSQPEGEPPLTREELIGDLYLLMTGGLNSSANLTLWSMLYIYSRPDWLAQLREEVAAVPPEAFTQMKQWPKIKATALEIERLRPPTPVNTLIPARDFEFQGVAIKKGTPVTHFLALTHFLPEIYEDPQSFKPERFLGETNYPAKAHAAFGGGAHMCIGMPLARMQMPLILANFIHRYDLNFEFTPSFKPRLSAALTPTEKVLPTTIRARV
jgi:cytochrome P450